MSKRIGSWVLITGLLFISGCATTGRNYQTDIDALNSRVSSLQGELSEKDQEIARLQGQLGQQQSALAQAEADKRMLSDKLDRTMDQMDALSQKAQTQAAKVDSDLK
jgi:chromosome segregation ATPase